MAALNGSNSERLAALTDAQASLFRACLEVANEAGTDPAELAEVTGRARPDWSGRE